MAKPSDVSSTSLIFKKNSKNKLYPGSVQALYPNLKIRGLS
ncbi:hypothetical protein LEP1GSC188_4888 [Leptospira weilii serovar Topaz str. LT2116]|uniref:Uncharacterized protein n=1 Tax=Leptospira weilii serovar Topaz str. LT2116 TaxID=1088540 RepID=M3FHW8_9LEPT|nr:hypothetical protein LEP1GSC188_4888 [Leptospira weilii serovar Topaz str. LT2116]